MKKYLYIHTETVFGADLHTDEAMQTMKENAKKFNILKIK